MRLGPAITCLLSSCGLLLRSRLERRLLLAVIAFSTVVVAATIAVSGYLVSRERAAETAVLAEAIGHAWRDEIVDAIAKNDIEGLDRIIENLGCLPGIAGISVTVGGRPFRQTDDRPPSASTIDIPLNAANPSVATEPAGVLRIGPNDRPAWIGLAEHVALLSLAGIALLSALALFVGFYAQALVVGPIAAVSEFLASSRIKNLDRTLTLSGRPRWPAGFDEIDDLADIINAIHLDFRVIVDQMNRARRRIEDETRRLTDFAGCASDWFFEQDADGVQTYLSKSFERDPGIPRETLLDRSVTDLLQGGLLGRGGTDAVEAVAGKKPFRDAEVAVEVPDGRKIWIRLNASPVFGIEGAFQGYRGTATDITGIKRAEEELATHREFLQAIGEIAKVGGWAVDLRTREVFWTEQTCAIHEVPSGYRPTLDEAIGFFDERDRPALERAMERVARDGTPYDLEVRFRSAKGRQLWTRTMGRAERHEDGTIIRLAGVFQDITEGKAAELALTESERRLSTLISNLPGVVYRCRNDADQTMEFVSSGIKPLTGYDAMEFLAEPRRRYRGLIHPEDHDAVGVRIGDALDRAEPFEISYRIIDKTGGVAWVREQGRGIVESDGSIETIEGLLLDISTQKQTEISYIKSAQRYHSVLETIHDGILVLDRDGYVVEANNSYAERSGYTQDELLGMHISDLNHQFTFEESDAVVSRLVDEGSGIFRTRHRTKDGKVWDIEVSACYSGIEGGRLFTFIRDISQELTTHERVRQSEAQYRALVENMAEGLWQIDADGKTTFVNQSMADMLRIPVERIVGQPFFEFVEPALSDSRSSNSWNPRMWKPHGNFSRATDRESARSTTFFSAGATARNCGHGCKRRRSSTTQDGSFPRRRS